MKSTKKMRFGRDTGEENKTGETTETEKETATAEEAQADPAQSAEENGNGGEAPEEAAKEKEAAKETEPEEKETEKGSKRAEKKLEKKLEEAGKEIDRLKDQLLRGQAEFQNFKRRNASTYADAYAKGVEDSMKAMLPVLDNLERALAAAQEDSPLKDGVAMTLRQFLDNAGRLGLEEVKALGEDFDPEKHEAVMRCPSDTPGKVLEVFQKGYRVKEKIIRHPMVKVGMEE